MFLHRKSNNSRTKVNGFTCQFFSPHHFSALIGPNCFYKSRHIRPGFATKKIFSDKCIDVFLYNKYILIQERQRQWQLENNTRMYKDKTGRRSNRASHKVHISWSNTNRGWKMLGGYEKKNLASI